MRKAIISLKDTNNLQQEFCYKVVEENENTMLLAEEYESGLITINKSEEDYKEIKDYNLYEEYIELICGDGYETERGEERINYLLKVFMEG